MASDFTFVERYFSGSDSVFIGAILTSCFVIFTMIFIVHRFMLTESTSKNAIPGIIPYMNKLHQYHDMAILFALLIISVMIFAVPRFYVFFVLYGALIPIVFIAKPITEVFTMTMSLTSEYIFLNQRSIYPKSTINWSVDFVRSRMPFVTGSVVMKEVCLIHCLIIGYEILNVSSMFFCYFVFIVFLQLFCFMNMIWHFWSKDKMKLDFLGNILYRRMKIHMLFKLIELIIMGFFIFGGQFSPSVIAVLYMMVDSFSFSYAIKIMEIIECIE